MNKLLPLMGVALLLFVPAGFGHSQSQAGESNVLDLIRGKFLSADKKNKSLTAENTKLKIKLLELQKEVKNSEEEVKALELKYPHRVKIEREQSAVYSDTNSSIVGSKGDDPLIEEAQELYLSGQSMNLSDEQKLHELHLYDLQYQKQELMLDLRELEVLLVEVQVKRREKLGDLQSEIQGMINEERMLESRVMDLERSALAAPQEIDLLKMEIKRLEQKIIRLKK